MTFDTRRRRASACAPLEHDVRPIDGDRRATPSARLRSSDSLRRSRGRRPRAAAAAGRARATRPPSSGPARAAAHRACRRRRACRSSPCAAAALPAAAPRRRGPRGRRPPARTAPRAPPRARCVRRPSCERRRQAVVGEAGVLLLDDQAGVLQQAEMARHARLRQAEDAGELGDVQPLAPQHPQQPQARLVAEQPVEAGGRSHINKSTFIDSIFPTRGDSGDSLDCMPTRRSAAVQSPLSRRDSERSARRAPSGLSALRATHEEPAGQAVSGADRRRRSGGRFRQRSASTPGRPRPAG